MFDSVECCYICFRKRTAEDEVRSLTAEGMKLHEYFCIFCQMAAGFVKFPELVFLSFCRKNQGVDV